MAIAHRPYGGETDYEQMRDLLAQSFALTGPPANSTVGVTVGDLDWWRGTTGTGESVWDAHLWFDDDELVGIAWPGAEQADLLVHPAHRVLEADLLDWAAASPLACSKDAEGRSILKCWSFDRDHHRVALFRERGMERTDEVLCFRHRSLDNSVRSAELPDGYTIRHVAGEEDLERRVEVHRDAFAPSKMTVEKHRTVMGLPTYRADLDLVVVAPDDTFAAYCLVWFDERNRIGIFEPVGCHSTHRRRGLTQAVMYEGMRRLKDLGATDVFVNSKLGVVPSAALYESVGMPVLDENHAWVKVVE